MARSNRCDSGTAWSPALRRRWIAIAFAASAAWFGTGPRPAAADTPQADFAQDIVPLLTRHGCNAGGCHGKASGQNGFRLSLFGFDPEFDHEAIVRQSRGRRISPAAPDESLLLLKATGQLPHGGGRRFAVASPAYRQLGSWIAAGAPAANPAAPRLVRIHVEPAMRMLADGQTERLRVEAEYSDGLRRDVSDQAQFSSNLETIASVDENGTVRAGDEKGEAVIMARFQGQVAVFRAVLPHGTPRADIPGFEPNNYVDRLAMEKWRQLGLLPSPPTDDATFLRRVTLDACGRLPTVDEVRGFLADSSSDKRRQLIDRLLDSPDYAAHAAMRWSAILRNSHHAGSAQVAHAFHGWIRDMIARNRPYDEFVRGIVAASGEWQDAPAVNWYWQTRDDQLHQTTADTAQVFLGLRLQCARCHHHPYERWGQADYYGLAGFYARLGRKSFGQPPPYFSATTVTTSERDPLTGKPPVPKYLDGPVAEFGPEQDPRHGLVDWMARPDNPFFARALVNRLWGHYLGRGLVHEVDDMRETNPPSNPALLDALTQDFVERGFDMKHVVRTILNSRVYQLSSEPTEHNEHDRQNFARYYGRRLTAEVFLDAVDQATDVKTRFNGVSPQSRAIDLPHEGFASYFLDTFDRPRRVTSCECERSSGATLAQVLLLANSEEVENKLASKTGRLARLLGPEKPAADAHAPPATAQIVDELYLATLSRPPRPDESASAVAYVAAAADRSTAVQDLLWTLINTREFMFNH
jgi:hypothetical protein